MEWLKVVLTAVAGVALAQGLALGLRSVKTKVSKRLLDPKRFRVEGDDPYFNREYARQSASPKPSHAQDVTP
jgi:hypothetical protein